MRRPHFSSSVLLLAVLSVACGYDNDGKQRVAATSPSTELTVSDIDTDAKMTDLETGVGLFIEYSAGGTWRVQLACDTAESKLDCLWDVYANTPQGGRIDSYRQLDLETEDSVIVSSNGEVHLQPRTTTDLDGVEFVTEPGEPVTFDVWLDGEAAPNDFMFWMNNGKIVEGAQSTVVELTPTEP